MFQPRFARGSGRLRAPADDRAAGRLGHDALLPPDGALKVNYLVGYDTWLGVVLAHTVMIAPFAVVLVLVALAQVDRRIDLAARGLGAIADPARVHGDPAQHQVRRHHGAAALLRPLLGRRSA